VCLNARKTGIEAASEQQKAALMGLGARLCGAKPRSKNRKTYFFITVFSLPE